VTSAVISLSIKPGIQRDGTLFDAPNYVDGYWVRFQRGRPRKVGGYNAIFLNASEISRGMVMQSQQGLNYVYSGSANYLQQWQTANTDGVGSGPVNISMSNFTASANNLWQFDVGYNSSVSGLQVVAHPGQNLQYIDSTVNTPVLSGSFPGGSLSKVGVFTATGTISGTTFTISSANYLINAGQSVSGGGLAAGTKVVTSVVSGSTTTVTLSNSGTSGAQTLTFDNNISVSGGACMIYPYLFVYGNNGLIQNCSAGDFTNWVAADANATNVSSTKVVKGIALRGGTTSPSGLFWSLDQLTRVSYAPTTVGGSTLYWRYDIISTQTSIMSSQCVIEYDGLIYWVAVDRFMVYNGVVQEIPNPQNMNFFFDNLNYSQRQKVWATKVPRWGEIWWFYPAGNSTECNNAIIYNVREQTWYDAGFAPGAARSAGVFSEVFRFPIWAGNVANTNNNYTLWQHETGTNQVYLTTVDSVRSYVETNNIGWVTGGPGVNSLEGANRWIRLERMEPDFVQSGDMALTVTGKGYADDVDVPSDPYTFSPTTLKVDMREQRREMRLRFESNTFNGNYEMGKILLSVSTGDERSTGNP
jgi:hypothetical protein